VQPEYIDKRPSVEVIARSMGDSVLIRWAPENPLLWKAANAFGYRLERITVAKNDSLLFGKARTAIIIADSIKPYSVEKMEPYIEKDEYIAIVGQAIYGEDFEVSASFEDRPSQVIERARDLENRFSFALFSADRSTLAAKAQGLWFTDKNVKHGEKYLYVVFPLIPPRIMEFDTGFTVIAVNDTAGLPKPYDLQASFGDRFVELSWNREYLQKFYTSYFVERSDDDGVTFRTTTGSPFLNLSENENQQAETIYRVDSLPVNGKIYYFRVRGISPFGEAGPPSEVVSGMGMSKSELINPIITRNELLENAAVLIEWEVMEEYASEISGFEVSRARNSSGPFTDITRQMIDSKTRTYTDYSPFKSGYYRVAAVDKTGEKHYSFPAMVLLPDSIPPAMPENLTASVDSTGIVTLKWIANTEEDIGGYRVYRSNDIDSGFVKINEKQETETVFYDTLSLGVLTKKVFYRIAAADKHYNESEWTPALTILRPDTIAPVPPSFSDFSVTPEGILLSWNNSPSEDVTDHKLFRLTAGETEWIRMNPVNDTTGCYLDKEVVNQTVYQYLLIATDATGLESEPGNTIEVRSYGMSLLTECITKPEARANRGENTILVTWKLPQMLKPVKVSLYRSVNHAPPVLFSTLSGSDQNFTDSNIRAGNTYSYLLRAVFSNGTKSQLSESVEVQY
jgi:fibronectin type 3 domain-containing protein